MKELIMSQIDLNDFEGHTQDQFDLNIEDCVIEKDSGTLRISVSLNFVVPADSEQKIKALIKGGVSDISDVDISYKYRDVVLNDLEALEAFTPRMVKIANGDYASLTEAIICGRGRIEDGRYIIKALGKVAAERLNKHAAVFFRNMIRDHLGLDYDVAFENDENTYDTALTHMKRSCEQEMAETVRLNAAASEKAKAAPVKPYGRQGAVSGGNGSGNGARRRRRDDREASADGNIIMGTKPISGAITQLSEVDAELGKINVAGVVFAKGSKTIKNGSKLISIDITDMKTSISLKAFVSEGKWNEIDSLIKDGDYIKAEGNAEWDRFDNCLSVMISGIEKGEIVRREDNYDGPHRVELHCHTKMSALDGLNDVESIVRTAALWKQPAVAITDHGVVQSFPDAARTADNLASDKANPYKIKIIYGMEGYVIDDEDCKNPDGTINYKAKPSNHIILLAATQEGLKNMYKLVSLSHLKYFYKKPRLPKSVISEYRDGIIIGSACEAGEVYRAIRDGKTEEEIDRIASFYDYLEIQPLVNNSFMIENGMVSGDEELQEYNRRIISCGRRLGKLTVATTDAHYDEPESAIYRNIIMAGQGYKDAEKGRGLYLRTTGEMLEEFSYLGEELAYEVVVENTNRIADMISEDILPVPQKKYPPSIEGADETLRTSCMEKAHSIYGDPLPEIIAERLNKELDSVIGNGYAVMYVSAQMVVRKSMEDGYLVGSRGSVGSSLAATMAGITEVNPLDPHYICPECKKLVWGDTKTYDCGIDMPVKMCPVCGTEMKRDGFMIPFATFLGFDGDKEPDIDLNFAPEEQTVAHKYVGTIFGEKNVFKAGTVSAVQGNTAYGYVMKYAEEKNLNLSRSEINRLVKGCTGVKKTSGQHPGGIIIVPDDHEIYEFCPIQHPANDMTTDIITTHFDYHKIDQSLLKLDILGHNIPSMIRQLQDMTGVDPMTIDLTDRKVLSIFNGIEALDIKDENYKYTHGTYAIPEFGTGFVRQMLDDTKPDKFADLVRIAGFSHGTDVWLNNAQDYIRSGVATVREVISARDDIMNYLILKGIGNKMSFQIMEDVRKNRPLKDEQLAVMKEHGVPDWYIDSCIKIQYMFPRAHSVAYVMMSFRLAWFKVYYPREFYATYFTSVAADFDADVILQGKEAILRRIDAVNAMGDNASPKDKAEVLVFEVAYEMYARGYKFRWPRLGASKALKFWTEDGDILLPFTALDGVGATAAEALEDSYGKKPFATIEDAVNRAKLNKISVAALRSRGVFDGLPEADQISFFSMM